MEEFGAGIVLLGVPAMIAVPLIVEGLKRLGLPARYATLAAVLVAGGVAGLAEAVRSWPQLTPLVRVIFGALIVGFSASGVYSQARYHLQQSPGNAEQLPSTMADADY